MVCPYCNKEMQKGFIQCRDGLHWTPKKQIIHSLSGLGKDAVLFGREADFVPNRVAVAYNCESCKKIMIDYSERSDVSNDDAESE